MKDTLLVTFGDTHCGSTRGLMLPKGVEDVDGNIILPNPLQKIIIPGNLLLLRIKKSY